MDERPGRTKSALAIGMGPPLEADLTIAAASEMDDGADRYASAIRRVS
jgi:hypothetical protein